MNLWQCQSPKCLNEAKGVSGAAGLRAIGWFFECGPVIYCPYHHPYGIEAALEQAARLQAQLGRPEGEALALRDRLAAASLPAIYERMTMLTDRAAELAYEQADEMLRARKGGGKSF